MLPSRKTWCYPYNSIKRKVSAFDIENILLSWTNIFYPESNLSRNMTPKREKAIATALYYSTPETIVAVLKHASKFSVYEKKDISYILSENVFLALKEDLAPQRQQQSSVDDFLDDLYVIEID